MDNFIGWGERAAEVPGRGEALGVHIHSLYHCHETGADLSDMGTHRLSSEPERRIPPSSDHDSALTQLLTVSPGIRE